MKKYGLLIFLILGQIIMAKLPIHFEKPADSYVSSCLFYATVLDTAETTKIGENDYTIKVKIKVNKAEEYGRADSGCTHYKGQEFTIRLKLKKPLQFRKNQKIKVAYTFIDDRGGSSVSYELVK